MQVKFIYPVTTPNNVILKSRKTGYIQRKFSDVMPQQLAQYVPQDEFSRSVQSLNRVSKYTVWGQMATLIPTIICGAILFGVGEGNRSSNSTPIYWYIGIIVLGISFIWLLFILLTLKQKFLRNLSLQVASEHTKYFNKYAIGWSLRYVEFHSPKKNTKRLKVWCELALPSGMAAQQPVIVQPNNYAGQQLGGVYIPMTQFHGQQHPLVTQYQGHGQAIPMYTTPQQGGYPQQQHHHQLQQQPPINPNSGIPYTTIPIDALPNNNNNIHNHDPVNLNKQG